LPDLRSKLPKWCLSTTAAIEAERWGRWKEKMDSLGPEHIEALRILTLEGPSNDRNIIHQLQKMGLARNSYAILEGLTRSSNFAKASLGQPQRQRDGERMYELKSEAMEFLEHYFAGHHL
jgi:hypothetical protein